MSVAAFCRAGASRSNGVMTGTNIRDLGKQTAQVDNTLKFKAASIAFNATYKIGKSFSIDFTLSLHTGGTARLGFADKTTVFMETQADYPYVERGWNHASNNYQKRQVVNNWTIAAELSFDYAKPFPAPEPSTAVLFVIGCVMA